MKKFCSDPKRTHSDIQRAALYLDSDVRRDIRVYNAGFSSWGQCGGCLPLSGSVECDSTSRCESS